ncbi:MAG: T9SS type A sorting domain-containing protein [Bacteroidota bacterium]
MKALFLSIAVLLISPAGLFNSFCNAQGAESRLNESRQYSRPYQRKNAGNYNKLPQNLAAILSSGVKLPGEFSQNQNAFSQGYTNLRHTQSTETRWLPDSSITDSATLENGTFREWGRHNANAYTYDAKGNVLTDHSYRVNAPSPALIADVFIRNEYNGSGFLTVSTKQAYSNGTFKVIGIDSNFYDSHNNLARRAGYYLNSQNQWELLSYTNCINLYNSADQLIKTIYQARYGTYTDSSSVEFRELGPNGEVYKRVDKQRNSTMPAADSSLVETPTYYTWNNIYYDPETRPDSLYVKRFYDGEWRQVSLYTYRYDQYNGYVMTFYYGTSTADFGYGGVAYINDEHKHLSLFKAYETSATGEQQMQVQERYFNRYSAVNPDEPVQYVDYITYGNAATGDSISRVSYFGYTVVAGVQNEIAAQKAALYPNPFSSYITIQKPAGNFADAYTLCNLQGKVLKKGTLVPGETNQAIDADDLPAGIFMLSLSQKGKTLQTLKVCKTE